MVVNFKHIFKELKHKQKKKKKLNHATFIQYNNYQKIWIIKKIYFITAEDNIITC